MKTFITLLLCALHFATFQATRDPDAIRFYTFGDSLTSHPGKSTIEAVTGCDARPYAVGGSGTSQTLDQINAALPEIMEDEGPIAVVLTVGAIDEIVARDAYGLPPEDAAQLAADNVTGVWDTLLLLRSDLTVYHVSYPSDWIHGTLVEAYLPNPYPGVTRIDVTATDPFVRLSDGVHPDGLGHWLRYAWAAQYAALPTCWESP